MTTMRITASYHATDGSMPESIEVEFSEFDDMRSEFVTDVVTALGKVGQPIEVVPDWEAELLRRADEPDRSKPRPHVWDSEDTCTGCGALWDVARKTIEPCPGARGDDA